MRRKGDFFDQIADVENLRLAFRKASRGKHDRKAVRKIERKLENNLQSLSQDLLNGDFHTSPYHKHVIYEPKVRMIFVLPFWPDRVVQHAILNIVEPYWESRFITDTYACIKGRGQHKGSERTMQFVRQYKYVYKADVHKFYPSLNHNILKEIIRKKIKDKRLLALLDDIIESVPGETNVPIGNLMSQWFGNIYMGEFDKYVKQELRCKAYVRYCDDFTIYSNDKKDLIQKAKLSEDFLSERLLLELSKSDIFPTSRGVDFLGYRHFPDGYMLVRKSTATRMKRHIKEVVDGMESGAVTPEHASGVIESVYGWASWANAYNLINNLRLPELRKEVASYAKLFGACQEAQD